MQAARSAEQVVKTEKRQRIEAETKLARRSGPNGVGKTTLLDALVHSGSAQPGRACGERFRVALTSYKAALIVVSHDDAFRHRLNLTKTLAVAAAAYAFAHSEGWDSWANRQPGWLVPGISLVLTIVMIALSFPLPVIVFGFVPIVVGLLGWRSCATAAQMRRVYPAE